ncbi:hypothetical protein Goshw_021446 [Gossypium schwendimanii]|uniref:Uncharacterized protein n=1 Tax=Gossypium schwendimanii TaxID=34291 RepID=A0A7J9LXD0_GOSSC|nr:hypothetical protein [Gossypium schwendimanii]
MYFIIGAVQFNIMSFHYWLVIF